MLLASQTVVVSYGYTKLLWSKVYLEVLLYLHYTLQIQFTLFLGLKEYYAKHQLYLMDFLTILLFSVNFFNFTKSLDKSLIVSKLKQNCTTTNCTESSEK